MYNKDTGTLHIDGYCQYCKLHPVHTEYFATEQDAYAYAGRRIKMCSACAKKKEIILKEMSK